jgi:hypothetical protein
MNPYTPPTEPAPKPRRLSVTQIKNMLSDWLPMIVLLSLAWYGLTSLMVDTGFVYRDMNGDAHFWFEPQLREWIHGK